MANRPAGRRTGGKNGLVRKIVLICIIKKGVSKMIIKSIYRTDNNRRIVALSHEYVYNAWIQGNMLYFYVLSNDKKSDVLNHFTACTENGKIKLMLDDVALALDSNDELINTVKYAFSDDVHNVITILETLFYVE